MSERKIKTIDGRTVTEKIIEDENEKQKESRKANPETESFGDAFEDADFLDFE